MTGTRKSGKVGGAKGPGKRNAPDTRPVKKTARPVRARTADARKESAEKYKFLIDATNTGYVILDDRGRVLDANQEYVRMTGRGKLADILGRPVTDWTASYDLERNAAEVRKCMEGGSVRNLVIDYVGPAGKTTPIEINATVLPGTGAARIFTVCRDITDRKRAEQGLADREALLRQIMDTASVAIFLVDRAGRITHANKRMAEMFRCPLDEIIGSEYVAQIHPSEREIGRQKMLDLLASEIQFVDLERHYWRKDGTEFWGHLAGKRFQDDRGTEIGLIGVITDIDTRKRAEETLRENEAKYRLVVENAAEGILIAQDGKIKFANPWIHAVGGYTAEDLLDKPFSQFVHPEDREFVFQQHLRRLKGEIPLGHFYDFRVLTKSGGVLWVEMKGAVTSWEGRSASVNFVSNVTERKKAEIAVRESENRIRSIIESIPVGMHMYRLEPDGRLVFTGANPAADRILGVDNRIFVGKTIEEAFPPLKDTEVPRRYREVVESGTPWQTESIEYKDNVITGAFEVHAFRTGPDTMVAAFEVITERKRAEMAVRESEAKFRRLYNETPVMMHSIDRNGNLADVNDQWLKVMGYERSEVLGRKVVDFFTPASAKYGLEVVQPAFFRDGVVRDVAYQFVKKNGEVIDVLLSATGERDAEGRVVRSQAVIEDVTERKRAATDLAHSHDLMRYVIEHMRGAVAVHDRDLKYIYVSRRYLDDYGVKETDVIGKHHYEVFPDLPQKWRDVHQRALRGEVLSAEDDPYERADGTMEWTRWECRPWYESSGAVGGIIVYTEVITERKRAEEALRESEERFRAITTTASDAILLMDDKGRIKYWNPAAGRIFGYSADEAIGRELHVFLAPERLHSEYHRGFARFVTTGQGPVVNRSVEMIAKKKDGMEFPIEVSTSAMKIEGHWHALGIVRDITERKHAEDALRQSEERFRDLAQTLPLTIFELDLQGRLTYVNRAALEKFGYTQQDVETGVNVMEVVAPQDRDRAGADMVRRISGGGPLTSEYLGLRKDGSTFPVMVVSNPILQDGRPAGLRGIVMDLTERKELEEERLKAQKLESIGTLAGGIAHDFNNLLQGIFGYISMAKLKFDDRAKSLAMLEQAEMALHQSVSLASQLLTFSKGGKPVKKMLELRPVIENACAFSLSGSRTDCRIKTDDGLWQVEADEGQLGQVVQNIVLNADQAMPAGGTVELTARNVPAGDAALPPGLKPGNYVAISISDSGIGIPAEYQSKIFDPYFTTKEKGSGLGLATSYSIIRNHGGLITVRSEPGVGSTLTVYLPAFAAKAAAAQDQVVVAPKRTGRVLVMDDDDVVRTVAGELLQSLGHDVELAVHGEEAIEKYRQAMTAGRPFDVVILDLTIRGGMGGAETVKKLLELDPAVKAVVSSGYSDDAVMSNYREHGFRSFLSKPYTAAGLSDMLNTLMS